MKITDGRITDSRITDGRMLLFSVPQPWVGEHIAGGYVEMTLYAIG